MTFITPEQITIGTKFKKPGQVHRIGTVIDIHKTYNSKNELVKTRYVATHSFLNQIVTDYDVVAVTIQKGFIK